MVCEKSFIDMGSYHRYVRNLPILAIYDLYCSPYLIWKTTNYYDLD